MPSFEGAKRALLLPNLGRRSGRTDRRTHRQIGNWPHRQNEAVGNTGALDGRALAILTRAGLISEASLPVNGGGEEFFALSHTPASRALFFHKVGVGNRGKSTMSVRDVSSRSCAGARDHERRITADLRESACERGGRAAGLPVTQYDCIFTEIALIAL